MGPHRPIRRVAIIGAGPSGLAAAKYLLAEKVFDKIDIFEQRDRVGGIWNPSTDERSRRIPIPQTNPRYGTLEHSVPQDRQTQSDGNLINADSLELESPLYNNLETNIPKILMAYSDKPFATELPLFPGHKAVLDYLEEYADDVRELIHFKTQVVLVRLEEEGAVDRWLVTSESLISAEKRTSTYDAVLVANGHYTVPYVPEMRGIAAWNEDYPGTILHSKAYRKAEDFRDQKVVVIGNSASGVDIAAQISRYCQQPLLLSSRSESAAFRQDFAAWREDVPEVVEFLPSHKMKRAIRFKSGRVERNIDAVVFATGYFYSFPFLDIQPPIIVDGFQTLDVYEHMFRIDHPTLAFPVLNLKVIPFPLAENQAAVIARVWAGRLSLPSKEEMIEWKLTRIIEQGGGKSFHTLKFPEDAHVLNFLFNWAKSAHVRQGLENNGVGKLGEYWDDKKIWMRSNFPDIKAAFVKRGEGRLKVTTLEELGFDYDKENKDQQNNRR